jgi:competence protein ComEC
VTTLILTGVLLLMAVGYFFWEPISEFMGLTGKPTVTRPTEGVVQVHFIDVGQGDCALILSEAYAILIDSGDSKYADEVIAYIRRLGVEKLDLIIVSHPHADHIGGMDKIIAALKPIKLIMPQKYHTTATFGRMLDAIEAHDVIIEYAKAGTVLEYGSFELEIIAPAVEFESINDSSAVVRLVHGMNTFLFTGDMEKAAEDDVLARRVDISSTVLKVSHHGSRTSSQRRFLDAVAKGEFAGLYAVISVEDGNSYNHPHDEVIRLLQALNFEIMRTDIHGTIVFESSSDGVKPIGGQS